MKRILAFILVVVMVAGLCACAKPEESIVGKWKHQNTVLGVVTETIYTFNEDGTGTKTNVIDLGFTYSFADDKLFITTSALGIEYTEEYTYSFGINELVLTGENDTITLEKIK